MPLHIVRNDITTMKVDAIVNAANSTLLGGGGVDGSIHRAAGPKLLAECITLGGCATGNAKITKGYRLPAKYVIHAVGPRWRDGQHGEPDLLRSCYETSLQLALAYHCESVAFPLISSGIYGYPKDRALRVAMDAISSFLMTHDMTVYLVIFDKATFQISSKLFADIAEYIDDRYADAHTDRLLRTNAMSAPIQADSKAAPKSETEFSPKSLHAAASLKKAAAKAESTSLEDAIRQMDCSFSEYMLQIIDQKELTDPQVYKKANMDRKLFNKIKNNPAYKPGKPTVLALAIALELDLAETGDFIARAGYALTHSSKFDIIIEYFISKRIYNIHEINEVLFAFDQPLMGC